MSNYLDSVDDIWNGVLAYCKEKISDTAYSLWIKPIEMTGFEQGYTQLFFSNEFKKNTVVGQYNDLIYEAFEHVVGFPVLITYLCPEDLMSLDEKAKLDLIDFKNETFTFDNFIVGPSNKFAYTTAKAVAADPGGQISKGSSFSHYNPLFIYGNSGLGKTHLLNAISYEIKRNYPEMKIVYIKSEDFLNEFIKSLGNNTIDEFHDKYRNVDVLLMDDVQFIAGKPQTEEEFFHTFNAIRDAGKQIVLTSDRPPKAFTSLVDRLRNRFESGLIVDIQVPEFETRCAIVKRKAEMLNFNISDNVVQYIAEKIKSNVRQLEGVTKKLHAMNMFGGQTINIAVAQQAIQDVLTEVQPLPVTISHIVEEVCRTTGVSSEDIYGKKHTANISNARKMVFYIIREVTDMSYKAIGKEFHRDHSTVMYNVEKFDEILRTDSVLKSQVSDIINNIKDNQ